jgi:uncharacterized protein (DUF488 family)
VSDIFTVGHSTRSAAELLELLRDAEIHALADVRAYPGSRRHPQFARAELARWLPEAGIAYVHLPQLGGRRRVDPSSREAAGWREQAFRAYAQHMRTAEFAAGLEQLEQLGRTQPTAIMCAEALWWRCHRRLIADALYARGWQVWHLGVGGARAPHELPPFAVLSNGKVAYPGPQLPLL